MLCDDPIGQWGSGGCVSGGAVAMRPRFGGKRAVVQGYTPCPKEVLRFWNGFDGESITSPVRQSHQLPTIVGDMTSE